HLYRYNKNKNINPPQPTFRCRTCTKTYSAVEMKKLLEQLLQTQHTRNDTDSPEMDGIFDSQPMLGEPTMTQILQELQTQRKRLDQHDNMFAEIQRLTEELDLAKKHIETLEETNRNLRLQLSHGQSNSQKEDNLDFPPLSPNNTKYVPPNSQDSKWAQPLRHHQQKPTPSATTQQRRLTAAARTFQLPSESHGFKYIYVPSRARQPTGQIRANLRRFGIDNGRILDIQYPARQTVSLLVHNDYADLLIEKLKIMDIHPINFDPFDPKNINDPKYESTSNENKQQLAKELHHKRAERSLQFIRAPVKYAVARAFHTYGWVSLEELKSILASRIPHRDD
ncbi:hypothetical protein BDC45DRAFT_424584, partial [Circinella umbellata]